MNKDKIEEILNKTNITKKDKENVLNYVDKLYNENILRVLKLQTAIAYIKEHSNKHGNYEYMNTERLLDILIKGEDNE